MAVAMAFAGTERILLDSSMYRRCLRSWCTSSQNIHPQLHVTCISAIRCGICQRELDLFAKNTAHGNIWLDGNDENTICHSLFSFLMFSYRFCHQQLKPHCCTNSFIENCKIVKIIADNLTWVQVLFSGCKLTFQWIIFVVKAS